MLFTFAHVGWRQVRTLTNGLSCLHNREGGPSPYYIFDLLNVIELLIDLLNFIAYHFVLFASPAHDISGG